MEDKLDVTENSVATVEMRPSVGETCVAKGVYRAECYDKDGNLKWVDEFPNVVATVGKNDILDKFFKGSAYTAPSFYMGLKGTGTALAADTMASHTSWSQLDITANRATLTWGTIASGSIPTSPAATSHSITAAGPTTVAGVYIVIGGTNANANTTGTLLSAGDFTGGNRSVVSGDTLNVTWTLTL